MGRGLALGLRIEILVQAEAFQHQRLALYCLWWHRYARALGDAIHHLEICEDGCCIYESLRACLVDDGLPGRIPGIYVVEQERVDQPDQRPAGGHTDVDSGIGDTCYIDRVPEFLATPPEPPRMGEYSVETLIEI